MFPPQDKLLGIIRDKLAHTKDGSSLQSLTEAGFQTAEELEQHTLLFTSALVPKAIASMLTSFLIATGGSEKVSGGTSGPL